MEKKVYASPEVSVIDLHSTQMLCASDGVVSQGGDNKPAGARRRRSSFDDVDW